MKPDILVTYSPSETEKEIYREILADVAHVHYLGSQLKTDRIEALKSADALIALAFAPREIDSGEIAQLKRVRLIQLVFAGADNLPFERLSENITLASNAGAFALEHSFFDLPKIIGSPLIADHVPQSMPNATRQALQNVRNSLRGRKLHGVLNRKDYLP